MQWRVGNINGIAVTQDVGCSGDTGIFRCINGTVEALTQQGVAASMVAMVVRDKDSRQYKLLRVEKGDQRRRITRIYSDSVMSIVHHPNIIVLERRQ